METSGKHIQHLEQRVANRLSVLLKGLPVGSPLSIDSSADLCTALEFLIPAILRQDHAEWERESIDGFFFSSAIKRDETTAELAGTCILISDQAVTPFALGLSIEDDGSLRSMRIRLGEAGGGPLGISGPSCKSRAARELLLALNERIDRIEWTYDVSR